MGPANISRLSEYLVEGNKRNDGLECINIHDKIASQPQHKNVAVGKNRYIYICFFSEDQF
jgi:hypothetical protein